MVKMMEDRTDHAQQISEMILERSVMWVSQFHMLQVTWSP